MADTYRMEAETPKAFVVINVGVGSERETLNKLKAMTKIKEAYIVYGSFDMVISVEADTMEELKDKFFLEKKCAGVVSGASTPDLTVKNVVKKIKKLT